MTHPDLPSEQTHLDEVYAHLDAERRRDQEALRRVMVDDDPEPQARVAREVEHNRLQERLERYRIAEVGLVFGRIDIADDEPDNPVPGHPELDRRHIGRMGVSDPEDDYRGLLMDWRAPQARPFYLATTANPEGVTLRRHIRTRGRRVRDLDDEWLDIPEGMDPEQVSGAPASVADRASGGAAGESVLREVLESARTGRMRGIVETIQREQDLVIRDSTRQTMVVQGGPGTGKTAVALHRVAWLLYTHRDQLEKTGVLILGPNGPFLDYISRVLPSLGETGVVLSTIADLYPGVHGRGEETAVVREVKGSAEMAHILRNAVRDRQIVPEEPVAADLDGVPVVVEPAMVKAARTRARRSRRPHNEARPVFREHLLDSLASAVAERIGADPLGGANLLTAADREDLRDELGADRAVGEVIDGFWPVLAPETLLAELLASRDAIASAAREYDDATREALFRADGASFGPSDPPLIDELHELLGEPPAEAAEGDGDGFDELAEAQDALDILSGSASQDLDDGFDPEILMAYDLIDAEGLAERQRDRDNRTTAERAAADREWAYGHIIIDEAQELSAMAWRMVRRRSPNGWMTLVGDIAQTGSPAGADSWEAALEPVIGTRWRKHELTVNYRTPSEIMDLAAGVLAMIEPSAEPPRSIRSTGVAPVRVADLTAALELLGAMAGAVPDAADGSGADASGQERLTAVIVADGAELPMLDDVTRVAVHRVSEIKGLEFDNVVLVDPDGIADGSTQGLQDLYVALTRATQRLVVVADDEPESLPGLSPA